MAVVVLVVAGELMTAVGMRFRRAEEHNKN